MRNFVDEMLTVSTNKSKQAAYDAGIHLLFEIQKEFEYLKRQEAAIQALGEVLQGDPEVDEDSLSADLESPTSGTQADKIKVAERPRVVLEAAHEVRTNQQSPWSGPETNLVKSLDVLMTLRKKGLDLGVRHPLAVIGTVLASADGYTKLARNTFEFTPPPPPEEGVEDLPW